MYKIDADGNKNFIGSDSKGGTVPKKLLLDETKGRISDERPYKSDLKKSSSLNKSAALPAIIPMLAKIFGGTALRVGAGTAARAAAGTAARTAAGTGTRALATTTGAGGAGGAAASGG